MGISCCAGCATDYSPQTFIHDGLETQNLLWQQNSISISGKSFVKPELVKVRNTTKDPSKTPIYLISSHSSLMETLKNQSENNREDSLSSLENIFSIEPTKKNTLDNALATKFKSTCEKSCDTPNKAINVQDTSIKPTEKNILENPLTTKTKSSISFKSCETLEKTVSEQDACKARMESKLMRKSEYLFSEYFGEKDLERNFKPVEITESDHNITFWLNNRRDHWFEECVLHAESTAGIQTHFMYDSNFVKDLVIENKEKIITNPKIAFGFQYLEKDTQGDIRPSKGEISFEPTLEVESNLSGSVSETSQNIIHKNNPRASEVREVNTFLIQRLLSNLKELQDEQMLRDEKFTSAAYDDSTTNKLTDSSGTADLSVMTRNLTELPGIK